MMRPTARLLLVCACALAGAYMCASGLLRLNEVFFQSIGPSVPLSSAAGAASDLQQRLEQLPPSAPVYDRLVLVLIDALRADMVLGSSAIKPPGDSFSGGLGDSIAADLKPRRELSAHMPYTQGLVASGAALAYVGHASVPTVTMPRLKALLTGRAPAFIDILKNFNSAALADDENLVALLRRAGKRLVFYGDDTWLKLFPSAFARSDGTSGFFTRDTVEVDANVTRHLAHELDPSMADSDSQDWDVLLLHYLGLDHVGHLRGPRSPLMAQKLSEMDAVVERIHKSVRQQDERRKQQNSAALGSLVLVCSDHGMSEVGNHGGATLEESSALLMFLSGDGRDLRAESDRAHELRRRQVDLVPTIASLFGLRIPARSTGVVLQEVVQASTQTRPMAFEAALFSNVQQLRKLGEIKLHASAFLDFDERYQPAIQQLHGRVVGKAQRDSEQTSGDQEDGADDVVTAVLEACKELQEILARSDGSEYDLGMFSAGIGLLVAACIAAAIMGWSALGSHGRKGVASVVETWKMSDLPSTVLLSGSVLQIASLSSSSSIENEHATAFFLLTTLLLARLLQLAKWRSQDRPRSVEAVQLLLLLVVTRALRTRNQVINFGRLNDLAVDATAPGNEFATDDSLSILSTAPIVPASMVSPASWVVWIGVAVGVKSAIVYKTTNLTKATASTSEVVAGAALFIVGMAAVAGAKAASDEQTHEAHGIMQLLDADGCARVVYAVSALLIALSVVSALHKRPLLLHRVLADLALWLLVSLVQRDSHLPTLVLISVFLLVATWWLSTIDRAEGGDNKTAVLVAGLGAWLAQAAFFSLGNSHLVTTVDISQSYLGLTGYSQGVVGLLTFLGAFSGPIVCLSSLGQWVCVASDRPSDTSETAALAIVGYQTLRFTVYALVVFLMRFHLFIWSVFAPKMLYEVAQLALTLLAALTVQGHGRH